MKRKFDKDAYFAMLDEKLTPQAAKPVNKESLLSKIKQRTGKRINIGR